MQVLLRKIEITVMKNSKNELKKCIDTNLVIVSEKGIKVDPAKTTMITISSSINHTPFDSFQLPIVN